MKLMVCEKALYAVKKYKKYSCEYYLINENGNYGIEVHKLSAEGDITSMDTVRDITNKKDVILDYLYRLARGGAVPVHLREIICDFLGT